MSILFKWRVGLLAVAAVVLTVGASQTMLAQDVAHMVKSVVKSVDKGSNTTVL